MASSHLHRSSRLFDSEDLGHHHDIEHGVIDVPRRSIFNIESGTQAMPHQHLTVTQPSVEGIIAIISMGSTVIVGLLGLNFPTNGDKCDYALTVLFHQHRTSFCFFVVTGVAAFYFTAIGMILGRFQPTIARTLNLIALVLVVLAFTVLLWSLLPKKFSWVIWIFFLLTILSASAVQMNKWANRVSTDKIISHICCDCIWCPTSCSPNVIICNSSRHVPLDSYKFSSGLRRVQSASF